MRFVPVKNAAQQDVQAIHRIRFQLIKWRTALANENGIGVVAVIFLTFAIGCDQMRVVDRRKDPRSIAISRLTARRGPNVAAVALANHNARVLWDRKSNEEKTRGFHQGQGDIK